MTISQGVVAKRHADDETLSLIHTSELSSSGETSSNLSDSDGRGDDGSLLVSYGVYHPDLEAERRRRGPRDGQQKDAVSVPNQSASAATITQVAMVLLIGESDLLTQKCLDDACLPVYVHWPLTRGKGVFTSNADGSLVLATHPVIASEFNVLGDSSWLFISFALAGACTQTLVSRPPFSGWDMQLTICKVRESQ
jgi:hypothetical protein